MKAKARLKAWGLPPLRIRTRTSWRGVRPRTRLMNLRKGHVRTALPKKLALGIGLLAFDWRRIARTAAIAAAAGTLAAFFLGVGWYPLFRDRRRG